MRSRPPWVFSCRVGAGVGFNENARLRAIILCWPLRAQLEVRAGRKKALHLEELLMLGKEPEIDLGGEKKIKERKEWGLSR